MEDIDIPEANKETVSTRIDTLAHDILKKISVDKYGSDSHMSSVLTDAVRFIYDPTPTQIVAKEKFLNNIDVHGRDPECSQSKVIHWTAPADLAEEMRSKSNSNRNFIESSIYWYESAYLTMQEKFTTKPVSAEQVVDWNVLQDNYTVTNSTEDIADADVPSKPDKRRPFIHSLIDENGVTHFGAFSKKYDNLEKFYDVSGLPSTEKTRRTDWEALIEDDHLIPTPSEMAQRPIETVESDTEAYYLRRSLDSEDNPIKHILEDYLQDTQEWIDKRSDSGTTYETTDPPFQRRENTMSVIAGYGIPELQEYAERANELQNKMVNELVEIPN